MHPGKLILHDGEEFRGLCPDWQKDAFTGEVVFTTGMTGYVESLTDPSYAGQILTFTYPLIGNYGIPPKETWEGEKIYAHGAILAVPSPAAFHRELETELLQWLAAQKVGLLFGVDTRALTRRLRRGGVTLGAIVKEGDKAPKLEDPMGGMLTHLVSCKEPRLYGAGKKRIVLMDFGMKASILHELLRFPWEVLRVPFNTDLKDIEFDGLLISNGPGDPALMTAAIAVLSEALKRKKPTFGICLGAQLLALAAGAKTYKMRFGHRGMNQPCQELATKRAFLTSQNHGYAVDEKTLPPGWVISFRNLSDGTVEGISHESLPFSAVQFHPEASPGPTDTNWLFQKFMNEVHSAR